jgi:DNA-binding NtrC family response regulator
MNRSRYSILLVDDQEEINHAFGGILRGVGYFVGYAPDGAAAFQTFSERHWDAVITDAAMPHMTGEELASAIKSISPKTPLILMTGHVQPGAKTHLFDEVLLKPFQMTELLVSVERVIPEPKILKRMTNSQRDSTDGAPATKKEYADGSWLLAYVDCWNKQRRTSTGSLSG